MGITLMKPKIQRWFRVQFESFGTDEAGEFLTEQVHRVSRPAIMFCDVLGLDEMAVPEITIDLYDDTGDRVRSEVITQITRQKDGEEFAVIINTVDEMSKVMEQWHLRGCTITACRFDELVAFSGTGLMIRLAVASKRIAPSVFGKCVEILD
jgi:hypothetical protein